MFLNTLARKINVVNILHSQSLRKVPEITVYFWIIKLLSTALGEAISDYMIHQFDPVIVVLLSGVVLMATLILQFLTRKYITWIYWLNIVMVAVFGTMMADVIHVVIGIPYIISAMIFLIILIAIFIIWANTEKTLSIHSINTFRRELFYWSAVLATFALGTATGDFTAIILGLGYLSSGILFIFLFITPAVAYKLFKLNGILAFWLAYILTRPLGASFADWFGKPVSFGGNGVGSGRISIVLSLLIIILVIYLSFTKKDIKEGV